MGNLSTSLNRHYHHLIARLVSLILKPEATYDPHNFEIWEKRGYHITPNHYYYPIPDTQELKETYPNTPTAWGIDLRPEFQLNLFQEIFPKYSKDYNSLPLKTDKPDTFFLYNDGFCGIDPHVYYSFVRHFNPKTIIEVGSGHSTLLGFQALEGNKSGGKMIVIDPWPRDFIQDFVSTSPPNLEHIPQKVQELEVGFFAQIQENDILFIDSSHVIRTGGDVCFLILNVLPSLPKGVLIHFHDIYLPQDYPKELLLEQHKFFTEQYLLQAYLIENHQVEVIFASHYISLRYGNVVKEAFPNAVWWTGESFWIRKR
jgi:hypothetical protein